MLETSQQQPSITAYSRPVIRDSTYQDYLDICGEPPPASFRGKTVTRNGEPIAIAGLTPSKGCMQAFSSVKPGVTYGTMEALMVSIQIVEWMRRQCPIIYILIESGKSDKYHRWIGFHYVMPWNGYGVYQL